VKAAAKKARTAVSNTRGGTATKIAAAAATVVGAALATRAVLKRK
jgi:hypothetical protein